ncbi:arsenate reductase [Cupriavidus basilensis OR16]|uniref:Arsenate reductase n=1 Tax=Cupriavidus basilensis OR16 TaxID=1127483 RepID=H1SI14_9BURK|nr:arsenate reductase [Cupriavidus basilensis OR16]
MNVQIYHNPGCGTSRNTLALIRNAGIEPEVIEYLTQPPQRAVLKALIASVGLTVREALRKEGTPNAELGLGDPALTADQLPDTDGQRIRR